MTQGDSHIDSGRDSPPAKTDMLTFDEVRLILCVSQGTVHNYRHELGGENRSGIWLFWRESVETWQGLRESEVLKRADARAASVTANDLVRARLAGITTPTAPPDSRMSYREVQRVIAWKRAGAPTPVVGSATETPSPNESVARSTNGTSSIRVVTEDISTARAVVPMSVQGMLNATSEGWKGVLKYIRTGDLSAVPKAFWLTAHECPPFILPVGALRARYRSAGIDSHTGKWFTSIFLGEHFSCDSCGNLEFRSERFDQWEEGLFP
jgi:hypothetical protein